MADLKEKQEPIRQSVHVACPIEEAFRLFTEGFGEWWPLASYSIGDEAESCAIEPWVGGRVFERNRSGEEREWGSVIASDPPGHLEFAWHPGASDDRSQTVEVEFLVEADGTRVTIIHNGWNAPNVAACALTNFRANWPSILEHCFASFVSEQMFVSV